MIDPLILSLQNMHYLFGHVLIDFQVLGEFSHMVFISSSIQLWSESMFFINF